MVGQNEKQPDRPPLFIDGLEMALREVSPTIAKRRAVRINRNALKAAGKVGAELALNLFPESVYTGVVQSIEKRSDTDYTLTGSLAGEDFSSFVLVTKGETTVMNIRPGKEGLIQIRYLGGGLHDIQKIDERHFPPCETGPEHAINAPGRKAEGDPGPEANAGDIIDVMVVYTPSARTAAGGTAAIEALVTLAIAESNAAYQESMINPRLRLAYVGMVNYTESASFSTDLDRLTGTGDGFIDEVHMLRNTHAADMVSLWVNNSASCGIGYLMTTLSSGFASFAFSTVHYGCATGYYSFGHELGHNMGCAHNREDSANAGLNPYSYGWRFFGTNGTHYRTIMAYDPGTRIQRFSNPNVNYFGTPTGVAIGNPNEAFNAQTINNSAFTIANFRQASSASGPPVIFQQPLSRTAFIGSTTVFTVGVSGSSPFTYQWNKIGDPIPGATQSSYTITNVNPANAGPYWVAISNSFGTATSTTVTLTVVDETPLGIALENNGFLWVTNGNAGWFGQTDVSFDGIDGAQSGMISHSQQTGIETTINGPGSLAFRWKVSSESGYDFLRFHLNGSQQTSISGEVNWQQRTFNIPSGTHTARWSYAKDGTVNTGMDKAWIDTVLYITEPGIMPHTVARTNGGLRFNFNGARGGSYTVYGSSNLVTWNSLTNFVGTNATSLFTDTNATNQRFYRVGSP